MPTKEEFNRSCLGLETCEVCGAKMVPVRYGKDRTLCDKLKEIYPDGKVVVICYGCEAGIEAHDEQDR